MKAACQKCQDDLSVHTGERPTPDQLLALAGDVGPRSRLPEWVERRAAATDARNPAADTSPA